MPVGAGEVPVETSEVPGACKVPAWAFERYQAGQVAASLFIRSLLFMYPACYCINRLWVSTLEVVLFFIPGCPPPTLSTILPVGWYNAPVFSSVKDNCSADRVKVTSCPL